jgi:hypothetical protein
MRRQYFKIDGDFGHVASGLESAKWWPALCEYLAPLDAKHSELAKPTAAEEACR